GSYSVELSAAFTGSSSISQTGDVPVDARSIQLSMRGYLEGKPVITFNGTPIDLLPPSNGSGSTITMVGDVTPFAGTTAELKVSCTSGGLLVDDENVFHLDSIGFSTAIVAEPSTLILTVIAAPFLLLMRRMRVT